MKVNPEFRKQLIIPYLGLLAKKDELEEFRKFLPQIEDYLSPYINETTDLERLSMIRSIISYSEKNLNMTMQR